MPANLPPDYYAAEKRLREAGSIKEKIEILREMLAIMPKHKGTDHLKADLKRKIAKLNQQSQKKQGTARSSGLDHIPREGAGQAVLVGPPNSGKSSILCHLTNAHSDVADYPFSTFKPVQGMMNYEDIQVQLVDLPPVSNTYSESWLYNIIRLADLVLLVIDLSTNHPEEQVLETFEILEEHKIKLQKDGERRPQGPWAVKSTILIGTKADAPNASKVGENLIHVYGDDFPWDFISIRNQTNTDELRRIIFQGIRVIRVYTKTPGKKSDFTKPYILPWGATVSDAAKEIHKELAEKMTFARLWGSDKYDGQRVDRQYVLKDKDIIEVHTR
jgi:ribosome-interacting GTPase 1